MSYHLSGKTIARYGNPYHQHTLAGGSLIFYAGGDQKLDTSQQIKWTWNPCEPDTVTLPEVGRAAVASDGSYHLDLDMDGDRPLVVALSVDKLDYAPATEESAFGVLGVATVAWRDSEQGLDGTLDIDLTRISFCALLKELDLWLVAGRVTDCATKTAPLIGGKVEAYDRDISQDDYLGDAVTDASGSFSIFFQSAAFKRIPSLPPPWDLIPPHEMFGGPDLFFHVSKGGTMLLEEPPSMGRTSGRENVGHCSYTELCVQAPTWTPQTVTLWTKIGKFQVPDSGGLNEFDADGFVASGKLAFTGNIDLIGQLSQTFMGNPTSFRFVYAEWPDMTTAPSYPADYQPVLAANINLNEPYGAIYTFVGPDPWDFSTTPVKPAPDVQGWIAVEQSPNFVRDTGVLVQLRTATLVPTVVGAADAEGTADCGIAVPAGPLRDRPRKLSFVLEIQAGSISAYQPVPVPIHINNSYAYMRFDLAELQVNSCTAITPSGGAITVHPVYTVAHPYLASFGIQVQRQGGSLLQVVNESYTSHGALWTDSSGVFDAPSAVYTDIGKCSYRSTIACNRRLTNGYTGVSHQSSLRTFCVD